MESLKIWNYSAFGIHALATVVTLFLLQEKSQRTVQMTRLRFDKDKHTDSRVDIPVDIEDDVVIDLKYLVVAFFAITAVAHLLYATDFFGQGWYSKQVLGFGWNPFRWIEYSLSASIMIYLISAASGTKDQVTAISAALITPGLMINGFTNERALKQNELHAWSIDNSLPKPEVDAEIVYSNLIPAWFLFAVHWYIILSNYSKLVQEAKDAHKPIEPSVRFMVYSQLVFFALFGVVQTFQVYRWATSREGRKEASFIAYEKAYIILSTITKLVLASTVVYALRD